MNAPSSPYDEPKNGDYVAYLAQFEGRQLVTLVKGPSADDAAQSPAGAGILLAGCV
jgi:hypothetical protein